MIFFGQSGGVDMVNMTIDEQADSIVKGGFEDNDALMIIQQKSQVDNVDRFDDTSTHKQTYFLMEGGSKDTEEQLTTREQSQVDNLDHFDVAENDESKQVSNHNNNADSEGAHMGDMTNNDETDVVLAGNIGNHELSVFNDSSESSATVGSRRKLLPIGKDQARWKILPNRKKLEKCTMFFFI
jgi:hypothetical protein